MLCYLTNDSIYVYKLVELVGLLVNPKTIVSCGTSSDDRLEVLQGLTLMEPRIEVTAGPPTRMGFYGCELNRMQNTKYELYLN